MSLPTFLGDTYSVEARLGAMIDGEFKCFSVHTTNMDDDLVTFDGVPESLDPYSDGTVPQILESERFHPDSLQLVFNLFSAPETDLFPSGFVDPMTLDPLVDGCLTLGLSDPLASDQPIIEVVSALVQASSDTDVVVPTTDVLGLLTNPWDGRLTIRLAGQAGAEINNLLLLLRVEGSIPEEPDAVGEELDLIDPAGAQQTVRTAARNDGSFVAVWQDRDMVGSPSVIKSLRFNAEGVATGSAMVLGSVSTEDALSPEIATGDDDFLVVWSRSGGSDQEIFGRRLDTSGAVLGSEFQINGTTSGDQERPAVAADGLGEFLVVWQSEGSPGSDPPGSDDTSGLAIVGRRVSTVGVPLASDFQVNSYTTDDQACPSLVERGGTVAVTWQSGGTATGADCLQPGGEGVVPIDIRTGPGRFGEDKVLDDFQINSSTNSTNIRPKVALRSNEVFVVWEGDSQGEGVLPIDIQGRRYSFDGLAEGPTITLGDEVVIDGTTDDASRPEVTILGGGFMGVTWDREESGDREIFSKFGRNLAEIAIVEAFQVNTTAEGTQEASAVVATPGGAATPGGFLVAWQSDASNGVDPDDLDLKGQRFLLPPSSPDGDDPIFADGFESGDATAWSSVNP